MNIPVDISQKAIEEIIHIIETKNIPQDYGLRLGTRGGSGCSGVNFSLGFDKKREDDIEYKIENILVYIRKGELMFLIGKKVDFYEGSDARGFLFKDQSEESSTEAL